MSDTKHSTGRHLASSIVAVVCALVALLLFLNRQFILDQLSVWQYKPSGEVVRLAERAAMSDKGTFYFYASQPSIQDAAVFNKECDRKEEANTAILGCYNGQYIYIYNVTNPQLDGIREVTAAHEMLHVAYARLDPTEKKKVDALLEAEYQKLHDYPKWQERMAFYERTEPGERANELHSMVGTEVAVLSADLEAYYRAYFSDRSKVIALHEAYARVFNDLQSRASALSKEYTLLGQKIESETAAYNKDIAAFNSDVEQFEVNAKDGGFSSQAELDAARDALLARATQLDARRSAIDVELARYKALRSELEAVASQSEALNHSIDSSLAPAPSL